MKDFAPPPLTEIPVVVTRRDVVFVFNNIWPVVTAGLLTPEAFITIVLEA